MPRSTQVILSEDDAALIIVDLKELAKKPKSLTPQAIIDRARPQIQLALQQGYSLEDICDVLAKHNLKITPKRLKQFLGDSEDNEKTLSLESKNQARQESSSVSKAQPQPQGMGIDRSIPQSASQPARTRQPQGGQPRSQPPLDQQSVPPNSSVNPSASSSSSGAPSPAISSTTPQ